MDYQKVTFQIQPNIEEFREVLSAQLAEIGFESFVDQEIFLEAYIPVNVFNVENIEKLNQDNLFNFKFEHELIPDQNWNERWEKNYFEPLLIDNKCLVRAPFHTNYPKAEYEIVIEPKMAFGTGNHETTMLMVQHILETNLTNKSVLDMGCGTGILSMLAAMRNAKDVTAIDIDSWAYESTTENCHINNCKNVTAVLGDASKLSDQNFDIIFANIHKNILIEDMEKYVSVLKPGGNLIMSGFYSNDLTDITNKAISLKLSHLKTKEINKWTASSYKK